MSNGKRWTPRWVYHDTLGLVPYCTRDGGPANLSHLPVEGELVMPTAEHNADLESLAQKLEGRAEIERDERGELWRIGDAFKRAAQLVRAQIEEGGK